MLNQQYYSVQNSRLKSINKQLTNLKNGYHLYCRSYSLCQQEMKNKICQAHKNPINQQRRQILQLLNQFQIDQKPKLIFKSPDDIILQRSHPKHFMENNLVTNQHDNKLQQFKSPLTFRQTNENQKKILVNGKQSKFRQRSYSEQQKKRTMNTQISQGQKIELSKIYKEFTKSREMKIKQKKETYTQTSELKGFCEGMTNKNQETEIENDLVIYMRQNII